jgi:hypothetical protein
VNETEIKDLFAAAVRRPGVDRIDLDAVLRGGRRRQRVRAAVTVGSVLAVPAIVVVVALAAVGIPGRGNLPAVTAAPPLSPVTSVSQLVGRWVAVSINGRPVPAARPATVIFGASGLPDSWQMQTACVPEPSGRVTAGPDGRFTAVATIGGDIHCPQLLAGPPDILGALTSARYARTKSALESGPDALSLLGADRNVIAQFRADPVPTCASTSLTVTFDGTTLRAKNTGPPCRLSGKDIVSVPWWRLEGTPPAAPAGILLLGDTLVQGYALGPGNTCPSAGEPPVADLVVSVEGQPYRLTVPGRQAREVQVCESASAAAPMIEPGPNSPRG